MSAREPDTSPRSDSMSGPPERAIKLLGWYCRGAVFEEVRGDLDELWAALATNGDPGFRARLTFWTEVVLLIRSHTILRRDATLNPGMSIMWKNYLHVALRSIRKYKTFSAINFLGLAFGIAATVLILLFVHDELSYDRYHEHGESIYRLVSGTGNSDYEGIAKVNGPWGIETARQVPSVASVARFVFFGQSVFELDGRREFVINDATNALGGFYADSTTFDVFSWKVVSGDAATALVEPNSIVVTESFARRWFGTTNAIDRTIRSAGETDYRVTAVIEDIPRNSHFRFDFLVSMSGYGHPSHDDWISWNQYYTYLRLAPGAGPAEVNAAIPGILSEHIDAEQLAATAGTRLQPLHDIYLRSDMFREIAPMGDIATVTTFALLAAFILFIAAVNFVNLSTARSSTRAREVGVRKSLGALRSVISRQFIFESVLTALVAGAIAVAFIAFALPTFNVLAGKSFALGELADISTILSGVAIVVGIGIVAGVYPAFVLSSYETMNVMKGAIASRGPVGLRKGLVVLQFTISAALIMSTGIVSDQLSFIREKPLGFDGNFVAGIPSQSDELTPRMQTVKNRMLELPGVVDVAISGNRPGGGDWGIPIEIPGLTREQTPPTRMLVGDADFPRTYGIQIAAGRDFDAGRAADEETALLVNEEFVRHVGWERPLGQRVLMPAIEREFEVVGVVRDFHFRSVHEAIAPIIIFQAPNNWYSMFNVRVSPDAPDETIERLSEVYAEFDPLNPMQHSFVTGVFEDLYVVENRIGSLLRIGTILAIVVACLGLFGLAAFTAERRTKEIGIRKVVGASTADLVALLTRETAALVGVALVPAVALSLYFGRQWLEEFAYRAGISAWTLAVGALIAVTLAVATTGLQAWRAAHLNPVKALRSE